MDQLRAAGSMLTGKPEDAGQQGRMEKSSKNGRNAEIEKTAKEMEALFTYQLLKIMRETSQSLSEEKKGFGNSTYMSLFDMEVSRLVSERGLGLKDTIAEQLTRIINRNGKDLND